jgi:cell division septation protein DedD
MMVTIRAGKVAMGVCLLALAAGCSREQQDWRSAEAADSIEGYGQFIQRHPESELAAQARSRVTQLGEDLDWQHAGSADSPDAYRQFITQHPNGKWAQEARIRIENFSLGAAGSGSAGATASAANASESPASAVASPGEVAAAPARPATRAQQTAPMQAAQGQQSAAAPANPTPAGNAGSSGFGVQLGAFSTEAGANNEWHVLTGRFGSELQGLSEHVVTADTASGRLYRLQAAVPDEARARAVCEILRKRSQACVPVLPH